MAAFSIESAYSKGWELTKKHWFFILLLLLITGAINAIGSRPGNEASGTALLLDIFGWVVSILLNIIMIQAALHIVDGDASGWAHLFDKITPRKLGNGIVATILTGLAVVVGTVLLVIPGIIAALTLSQTLYLIVDRDMSAIEAMSESARIMKGNRLQYLGFGLVGVIIVLISIIPLGLGLLVSLPLMIISQAVVYRTLGNAPMSDGPVTDADGVQRPQATDQIVSQKMEEPAPMPASMPAPAPEVTEKPADATPAEPADKPEENK